MITSTKTATVTATPAAAATKTERIWFPNSYDTEMFLSPLRWHEAGENCTITIDGDIFLKHETLESSRETLIEILAIIALTPNHSYTALAWSPLKAMEMLDGNPDYLVDEIFEKAELIVEKDEDEIYEELGGEEYDEDLINPWKYGIEKLRVTLPLPNLKVKLPDNTSPIYGRELIAKFKRIFP